jgi:hypothetical protein
LEVSFFIRIFVVSLRITTKNKKIMSATSGAKTWEGKAVYNELGTLFTKVSGIGGTAYLTTATYNSCDGIKYMWRLDGVSGWFREGGYMSESEQEAYDKGIAYCIEQGYEIVK